MFEGLADPADLGSNAIYSVNADGTNLKRLTADDDHILNGAPYPQWSPDGQRIAFVNWARALSGGFVPTELYVMDRDGTNRRLLLHITEQSWQKTQSVSGVAWSPARASSAQCAGDTCADGRSSDGSRATVVSGVRTAASCRFTSWRR